MLESQTRPSTRNSFIIKSLLVIVILILSVLIVNYYLISNCPDSNAVVAHSSYGNVDVKVYYEILCPDSKHFIVKQVVPAAAKFKQFVNFQFVPFGKASFKFRNNQYQFRCQHGPEECHGNKLHACVVNDYSHDPDYVLNVISCSMENFKWGSDLKALEDTVYDCKVKFNSSNTGPVLCPNADMLLAAHGQDTNRLAPPVSFIPTVTINNVTGNQGPALRDLSSVICKELQHFNVSC